MHTELMLEKTINASTTHLLGEMQMQRHNLNHINHIVVSVISFYSVSECTYLGS